MENMISQNTLGIIIQALAAIVVAIITYVLGPSFAKKSIKDTKSAQQPPIDQQGKSIFAIASGVAAAITFIVI